MSRRSWSWWHAGLSGVVLAGALIAASLLAARADDPIKLVFAAEAAPLAFEEEGRATGIEIDVAREVFTTRLGFPIEASIYPWERAQQMVRTGQADGFITIGTTERRAYASCGQVPVLRADMRTLLRRDHPRRVEIAGARSLAELHAFEIVSYLGNGWGRENLAGFRVYDAVDIPTSLRGLALGRGDLSVVITTTAYYYLDKLKLNDDLVMLPVVLATTDFVLCLGNKSPHASKLAEFERVLTILRTDGGYGQILTNYGLPVDTAY